MITCKFEDGGDALLRHVTVDIIVLNKERTHILLVKRAAHLNEPNKYCFPGGYIDRDEFIHQAAVREVLEETGYEVELEAMLRINDNPVRGNEDRQNIEFMYISVAKKRIRKPDDESEQVKWFDLNALPLKKEFAFDHFEGIQLYKKYIKKPFSLPIHSGFK